MHAAEFEFSGRVKIQIKIVQPTQKITMHHRQLTIPSIDLVNVVGNLIQSNHAY